MRVLGIDPGTRRTGFGLLDGDNVAAVACGHSRPKVKGLQAVISMIDCLESCFDMFDDYEPELIVVESQQAYTGQARNRSRPQDLVHLAQVAGACCSLTRAYWPSSQMLLVPPMVWKGQVPKAISQARTLRDLGIPYKKLPKYAIPDPIPEWGKPLRRGDWFEIVDALGLSRYGQSLS